MIHRLPVTTPRVPNVGFQAHKTIHDGRSTVDLDDSKLTTEDLNYHVTEIARALSGRGAPFHRFLGRVEDESLKPGQVKFKYSRTVGETVQKTVEGTIMRETVEQAECPAIRRLTIEEKDPLISRTHLPNLEANSVLIIDDNDIKKRNDASLSGNYDNLMGYIDLWENR